MFENVRKYLVLDQKDVAKMVGINVKTYSTYETGRAQPSLETVVRISEALGVRVDDLLYDEKDVGPYMELLKTMDENALTHAIVALSSLL